MSVWRSGHCKWPSFRSASDVALTYLFEQIKKVPGSGLKCLLWNVCSSTKDAVLECLASLCAIFVVILLGTFVGLGAFVWNLSAEPKATHPGRGPEDG